MNKELSLKLKEEFTPWFEGLYGEPSKTCLTFGIECGSGWFDLIRDLCLKIKEHNPENFRVEQVKEKFGGLRFYASGGTKEIFDLIHEAESKSYEICEACGSTEKVTTEGAWARTECANCRKV